MRVLFLHALFGQREGHNIWYPAFEAELKQKNLDVVFPKLDIEQTPEKWLKSFSRQVDSPDKIDICIGHSAGGTFLLRLLEKEIVKPQQSIFIATPSTPETSSLILNKILHGFVEDMDHPFDWEAINRNTAQKDVVHSQDDPIIPVAQATQLGKRLKTIPTIIQGCGHFNTLDNYLSFSPLLHLLISVDSSPPQRHAVPTLEM